ncbi:MAG: HAMP domain-containing histidine kinase [Bacteroidetes bacterium]|nr:HAMP domain-containing histidine kinase [Bacteroidota bacterium]
MGIISVKNEAQLGNISNADVNEEVKKSASRFHIIGAWVAIIFDPIFGITDYFNIGENWTVILALRILVALVTLVAIWMYKRDIISVIMLPAIPFTLISLQNAFTYSLIDNEHILGHNLNYLALFIGASLFLVWPVYYSLIAMGGSTLATIYFVGQNQNLNFSHFLVEGGVLLAMATIFSILMIQARYSLRVREIRARLALDASLKITADQKVEIQMQNARLVDKTEELDKAKGQIEEMNAQLVGQNQNLEQQVLERTASIQEANKQIKKLVYSLSHDFRTPMVNAQGLLQLGDYYNNSQELKGLMHKIGDVMYEFDEKLRNMMNYSVYWEESTDMKQFSLLPFIKQIWHDLNYLHTNVELIIKPENEAAWRVFGDIEKLKTVFYCVIANGIKYNDKPNGLIELTARETDKHLVITVVDNGQGMDKDQQKKAFEMFYRGNAMSKGTGMGLFVAKGIVEQLAGSIELSSTKNVGTSITIRLPIKNHL